MFQLGAQNTNRPLPGGLISYEFEILDSNLNNYHYSFSASPSSPAAFYTSGLLDSAGYLAWFTILDRIILDLNYDATHQVYTAQIPVVSHNYVKLGQGFDLVDSIAPSAGNQMDIHEQIMDVNGHTYVLGVRDTTMDLSSYTFDGNQGLSNQSVKSNSIMEFDVNNNLVFYWNASDHVHPSEFHDGFPYNENNFDYFHANSIDLDFDGNILVSARHTNTIYKISKQDGSILWRLGGSNSDFTFPNDNGFSGQHDFRYLGGQLYSMHDNGNFTSTPKESRAVEFELDTIAWTATRVWRYKHNPKVYGPAMGNNDLTSNGDNLINWGRVYYPEPTITLVDASGFNQMNMYLGDSLQSYRSHALELDYFLPRKELLCSYDNGQMVLTCQDTVGPYIWSTGDSTQSITVSSTGEYMCWNPYGIGWLGSKVFKLTDLSNPCGVNKLEEFSFREGEIKVVYSLAGKRINQVVVQGLYIVRYENGAFEKRWWDGFSWN